jgi:phospholipid/cholesterol/gamma-HCH transport system permease protein
MNPVVYADSIKQLLHFSDIGSGVIKGLFYGYLIGSIGAYVGYHTTGGAKGVGLSTTRAVVLSSVTVFVADLFLSIIFLALDWEVEIYLNRERSCPKV